MSSRTVVLQTCLHASRRVDDRLVALSGIEYVTLNGDGLITSLDNRMVTADSRL
ncbi:hypothetical protein [Streptomyces sp. P3]|uniref:hypothetical protein n=1 Tax=Streptomyces sp. P3 TaxID=2135430 RepID=UPI0020B12222|nr:hypothetical protein [Streptomyces sp. P3]